MAAATLEEVVVEGGFVATTAAEVEVEGCRAAAPAAVVEPVVAIAPDKATTAGSAPTAPVELTAAAIATVEVKATALFAMLTTFAVDCGDGSADAPALPTS